jgi:dipeptidyl aminopeptidase/acylaminoacyl peptidase
MHRLGSTSLRALLVMAALGLSAFTLTASPWTAAKQAETAPATPTLEQLFPKYGLLGAPVSQVAFSHDGKYGAYVHNRDLVILDVAANTTFRAVSVQTLAPWFNADKDTPKLYYGVFHYAWSPTGDELLFLCEGHIYRYQLPGKTITRLTPSRVPFWEQPWFETLRYLPDGSGYLLARGGYQDRLSIWQGDFETKAFQTWAPQLPAGEQVLALDMSVDGKHVALTTRRGPHPLSSSTSVKIPTYRDRFLQVRVVPRAVSGEPLPESEQSLFVAPLDHVTTDADAAVRVWSFKYTSRADVVSPVNWSPDSRKLAFARYAKIGEDFEILEVAFDRLRLPDEVVSVPQLARVVHRFAHTGGPSAPPMLAPWYLADSRHLVFVSDKSGYLQLHKLDAVTGTATALTQGEFEVYPIALSKDRTAVYVAATREDAIRRDLYRVDATDGRLERLTSETGTYGEAVVANPSRITAVAFSPTGKLALTTFSSFGTLRELVRLDLADGRQQPLTSSHRPEAQRLATVRPEFFTFKNRHGDVIHGYMFKPPTWQKTDKRPALIYGYGGQLGIRKDVMDGDVFGDQLFAWYLAQRHGYVTVVIDPRGSSGYGAKFENANYGHAGQPQVEDLEDAAQYLAENCGVDAARVAVSGWSYGGFATQMCLCTSDKFAAGIAGAGPAEWNNYNDWYTSITIGSQRQVRQASLLRVVGGLKGKLLLVHGLEDDNVLAQDTIRVYSALLQAGKVRQVELFLDPHGGHGLRGDVWEGDRYAKYEQFLLQALGSGN